MKLIFLFFILLSQGSWAGYTDDAYRLYKKGDYKQAYHLYSLAYRYEGNIKAAYNMAVMIERQKVHDRNILNYRLKESVKWYQKVANSVPDKKKLTPAYCNKEIYPYYLKTFKKLSNWSQKGHFVTHSSQSAAAYTHKAKVLKRYCNNKKNHSASVIPHPKSAKDVQAEAYLKKCSAAKIIPPKDRTGIDIFPCMYYKKFPQQMKKIMYLAQFVRLYKDPSANNKEDEIKRINKKARKTARPVLSYLIKEQVIPCYHKTKTEQALAHCYFNYLSDCQQLTFGEKGTCLHSDRKEKKKMKNITEEERKQAIRKIKNMFQKGDICPTLMLCS